MTDIDPSVEEQYVFPALAAQRAKVYAEIARRSEAICEAEPMLANLAYGLHPRERIDLFPTLAGAPLFVFLHGGYWSGSEKESFRYVARPFLRRGVAVAVVGYPLAPQTPLADIVGSVCRSIGWLASEAHHHLGCSPSALAVGGHSAGGHLAAMATLRMTVRHETETNRPAIVGCAALSGLFDLRPLHRTSVAARAGLTEMDARLLSPALLPTSPGWLVAGTGANESAGFISQTHQHVDRRVAAGAQTDRFVVPQATHYSVLLDLAHDDSLLAAAVCARLMA
jgi:arylformamidase